jgi:hypothetical protein
VIVHQKLKRDLLSDAHGHDIETLIRAAMKRRTPHGEGPDHRHPSRRQRPRCAAAVGDRPGRRGQRRGARVVVPVALGG